MEYSVGARVRMVHFNISGIVVSLPFENPQYRSQNLQVIRWDPTEGSQVVLAQTMDPAFLRPVTEPVENDPPIVVSGYTVAFQAGILDPLPMRIHLTPDRRLPRWAMDLLKVHKV